MNGQHRRSEGSKNCTSNALIPFADFWRILYDMRSFGSAHAAVILATLGLVVGSGCGRVIPSQQPTMDVAKRVAVLRLEPFLDRAGNLLKVPTSQPVVALMLLGTGATSAADLHASKPIIYVGDQTDLFVNVYHARARNPKRLYWFSFGNYPLGMCLDSHGTLYVTGWGYIAIFPRGATQPSRTISGPELGILPACTVDAYDNLWVSSRAASFGTNGVIEFAPGGSQPIYTLSYVHWPMGLAFDRSGNLYVAGGISNNILVFPPGGRLPIAKFPAGGDEPSAIAFDGNGVLYVANFNGGGDSNVAEFAPGSHKPKALIKHLDSVEFLSVSRSGRLYVGIETISGQTGYVAEYRGVRLLAAQITEGLRMPGGLVIDGLSNL